MPVVGGMSFVLFGMISAIGIRTMAEAKVDFSSSRNLLILSIVLVTGIGVKIAVSSTFIVSGIALAALDGIILNLVLPENVDQSNESAKDEDVAEDVAA
jgi:uracil permease